MKFEKFELYTHIYMRDVAVLVLKCEELDDKFKLLVKWFTRKGLNMNATETISVLKEDHGKWFKWEMKK